MIRKRYLAWEGARTKRFRERLYAYRHGGIAIAVPLLLEIALMQIWLESGLVTIAVVGTTVVGVILWAMTSVWFKTPDFKREFYRPLYRMDFSRGIFGRDEWHEKSQAAVDICNQHGFDYLSTEEGMDLRIIWITHEDDLATLKLTL